MLLPHDTSRSFTAVVPHLLLVAAVAGAPLVSVAAAEETNREPVADSGCTTSSCHGGIETITSRDSRTMRNILRRGAGVGDPEGCVVCHGGDPTTSFAEEAHRGSPEALQAQGGPREFYPDPGSPCCGTCHPDQVGTQWNSLMMTEAGKIQGTAWSFGALTGYAAKWGNYAASNPADPSARLGTDAYREIMRHLAEKEPGAFPETLEPLPEAITDLSTLAEHPEQSVFTYIRNQRQRCHLEVRGREERGDYRGMGCSACHLPYGNEEPGLFMNTHTRLRNRPASPTSRPLTAPSWSRNSAEPGFLDDPFRGSPSERSAARIGAYSCVARTRKAPSGTELLCLKHVFMNRPG